MTDDDQERDISAEETTTFGPDNLYHTAYAAKDYPHEVPYPFPILT